MKIYDFDGKKWKGVFPVNSTRKHAVDRYPGNPPGGAATGGAPPGGAPPGGAPPGGANPSSQYVEQIEKFYIVYGLGAGGGSGARAPRGPI